MTTSIYLARGHGQQPSGRHDPGAVGGGWSEQDAADVVVPLVAATLESAGVDVFDEGNDDPNYVGSVKAANRRGDDLFVAFHWDWTGGLDVHAFHHSASTAGKQLATAIVDALGDAGADLEDRPVRDRDGLYVIGKTDMPAVLVELGRIGEFGDDPTTHLTRLARACAAGILAHLDIDPPAPKPAPTTWTERLVDNLPPLRKRSDLNRATDADRRLQGLLAAAGDLQIAPNLDGGRFDGKFGPSTQAAVRTFQSRAGLKVDGIVGRNTWTALLDG